MNHKTRNTNRYIGISAAAAVLLTACGTSDESAADDSCTIGFSIVNQQDIFFTQMVDGATEQAEEVDCELNVVNADNDPEVQASDINRLVTQQVDVIVVNAIDVDGSLPALREASQEGIHIVAIDMNIGEDNYDSFVGVDNGDAAQEFADYMLDNGFNGDTSYGIIGAQNSAIQNLRSDTFQEIVDDNGAEMLQAVNGENQNEVAATAADNLLSAQSDLDYVYTTGTPATLGAVSSLSGSSDDVPSIVGWDLTTEIIDAIDDGLVQAIVQQDAQQQGIESVDEARRLADGESASGEILVPIEIVTEENVDDFREIYE